MKHKEIALKWTGCLLIMVTPSRISSVSVYILGWGDTINEGWEVAYSCFSRDVPDYANLVIRHVGVEARYHMF